MVLSYPVDGGRRCYSSLTIYYILKLKIHTQWPKSTAVNTYPEESAHMDKSAYCHTVMAPTCKQPKCQSTVEGINKLWHHRSMEYHKATKMNTLPPHTQEQNYGYSWKQNVEPGKPGTKDGLVRVLFHSYKISNQAKRNSIS